VKKNQEFCGNRQGMDVIVHGEYAKKINVPYAGSEHQVAILHKVLVNGSFLGRNPTCEDCHEDDEDSCYISNLSFSLRTKFNAFT
jgi:hypothetical protein